MFDAEIESVLDLGDGWDVVGRISDVRVHVWLGRGESLPRPGNHWVVHTDIAYDVNS